MLYQFDRLDLLCFLDVSNKLDLIIKWLNILTYCVLEKIYDRFKVSVKSIVKEVSTRIETSLNLSIFRVWITTQGTQ